MRSEIGGSLLRELWTLVLEPRVKEGSLVLSGCLPQCGPEYERRITLCPANPRLDLDYRIHNPTDERRVFLWKLHAAAAIRRATRSSARHARPVWWIASGRAGPAWSRSPGRSSKGNGQIGSLLATERWTSFSCLISNLLQADHTLSGIDMALWDLFGKQREVPVYELLGYERAYPKTPYASVLFGETPQETFEKARQMRRLGYRAGKFGWADFGKGSAQADADQLHAAREGLGEEGILLIDVGTIWIDDVARAILRIQALKDCRVTWLEEPFVSGALDAYRQLAALADPVKLAGGEGAHDYYQAQHMIDHAGIGFVQIDAGRIGGISVAKRVADHAQAKGVTYVNHTFTSHLALSASLQPYAGIESDRLCEYPMEPKRLATEMTVEHLLPDAQGRIALPNAPGLGVTPDLEAIQKYLVDVEIRVEGELLYQTPTL